MAFVHVEAGISNPVQPEREERLELLVDTGAMMSVIPESILETLGIRRIGRRNFRGFGGVISRDTGGVNMSYDGAVAVVPVDFGEGDDSCVLGVTALESLGYQVNPVAGELKPTGMLLLNMTSS